jgi:hypothetical protein
MTDFREAKATRCVINQTMIKTIASLTETTAITVLELPRNYGCNYKMAAHC